MMTRFLVIVSFLLFSFGSITAQPRFKGGDESLNFFLKDHLVYPDYSKQNCISGTIQVSFNLDHSGKVYGLKVYRGMGIDLDDEALRVIKLTSGKWIVPADHDPNSNIVIPITFAAEETRCREYDERAIASSVVAYKARIGLTDAVVNYYTHKYAGKADTTKEDEIIALKLQLGFDDTYINRIMRQANRKFKQGDKKGACEDWLFIKYIGSEKANDMLSKYCN
jgi:TonB family protein